MCICTQLRVLLNRIVLLYVYTTVMTRGSAIDFADMPVGLVFIFNDFYGYFQGLCAEAQE